MSYNANRTAHRLLCNCLHRGDSRHLLYATLTVSAAATRYRRAAHHQLTRPVGPIGLVGPGSPDPVASTARLERGLCAQRASLAVHPRPQPRGRAVHYDVHYGVLRRPRHMSWHMYFCIIYLGDAYLVLKQRFQNIVSFIRN